jgi:hypothetical protein
MFAAALAAHRLHRRGQDGVGVTAGNADTDTADVDAEPPSPSGVLVRIAGPVRQTVLC